MLLRMHFRQLSIIQLFFFFSLLFFQNYYDYSMAQKSVSNTVLDDTVIKTIVKLNEIAPKINNRELMDFKNPVSFSPGIQLLLNSDNQEIFIKATVSELVKFYAYYKAVNYLYETDKINLIKFIYKDNLADILQKNIDNLENLITNKIITLYSDTKEELKSAVNTLFEAISNIEHQEAKFLMTPLIEKITEKIINKSQEDYFNFDTTNIINYIQTQSSEVINAGIYEKGSRAWWAVIGGIVVGAFVLATIGSFFIGLAGLSAWYYTPNIKTAKFCAQSLIKIYDLWPFIQKPSSHYIFPNSVVANIAFLDGNYEECIQLCNEWIENAQAEEENESVVKANRATADVCEAKVLKARALAKSKRYTEAEVLITNTIPFYTLLGQKHIPFMYLGKFFKEQGNTFLAKTNLKIAAEHKPLFGSGVNQFIAYYEYADLLDQMGDGKQAFEFYKKADKACKIPWSPPSNKAIGREYRTLIDEAWVLKAEVIDKEKKYRIPETGFVINPNETKQIKISGELIGGEIKRISADDITVEIDNPTNISLERIVQSGNLAVIEIKNIFNGELTKNETKIKVKHSAKENKIVKSRFLKAKTFICKKIPLGHKNITYSAAKVGLLYIPNRNGGLLEITSSGKVNVYYQKYLNLPIFHPNNMVCSGKNIKYEVPVGRFREYFLETINDNINTISTTYTQDVELKRPWNFYWWSRKGDYIRDKEFGNKRSNSKTHVNDIKLTDEKGRVTKPESDVIGCGGDGILQSIPNTIETDDGKFDDEIVEIVNLFDPPKPQLGSNEYNYAPLYRYDHFFNLYDKARKFEALQNSNYQHQNGGHCLGASIASVVLNQPQPSDNSNISEDGLEGLWAELCEHKLHKALIRKECPAIRPKPGKDKTDTYAAQLHLYCETYMFGLKKHIMGNLRPRKEVEDPVHSIYNHAIWKYSAEYKEAENNNDPRTMEVKLILYANEDHATFPTNDTTDRIIEYRYIITYNREKGIPDKTLFQDWLEVAQDAYYPPGDLSVLEENGVRWQAVNPFVTEKNVRLIDLNN